MKLNGYQIVSESVNPLVFYHYLFPNDELTSKEILQTILKSGVIKPGTEIEGTEKDYEKRPEEHRRDKGIVYLTPHKLYIPNVYRFIIPESMLKDYKVQLRGKEYPKEFLQKALNSIKEDSQELFERYKTRRFRGLIQILYQGTIPVHGLKYTVDK